MAVVRLHGILREEAGVKEVEVPGSSLDEILSGLPKGVREVLERYSKYLVFLVNGKVVHERSINLKPEDVVDVTIYVSGGSFQILRGPHRANFLKPLHIV